MDAVHINVNDLRTGRVVAEDIFANTKHPILRKNTILTENHIQVLKAFQVFKVPITIEEKEEQNKSSTLDGLENSEIPQSAAPFEKEYIKAVEEFKKLFLSWESGAKIEITKIREVILPLVDEFLNDRSILFKLNNYSTPKDYLYHHCIATGLISAVIAHKLGFERGFILQIAIAGVLADCGMAKIAQPIREKQGTLTEQEFALIRKHPLFSFKMVANLPMLKDEMKLAIYQHHERLDGSGYVEGNKMGKITTFAQIIAIADTFHAMTSERVYRSKESPFKVIEMFKESEFGKFDIKVVEALIQLVAGLPIGTHIVLSNLEHAKIMFINSFAPTRPLIKLINTGEMIDLSKQRNFYILQVIPE